MTNVNTVWETFYEYCGSYWWIVLLGISTIFIISQQKKQERKLMILYAVISLIVIYNDLSRGLIGKVIDTAMYYRFFWLVPVTLICAYALMLLIGKFKNKLIKIGIIALVFVALLYKCGDFRDYQFGHMPQNSYMISDDVVQISELLTNDKQEEHPEVAMPMEWEKSYRTYDASVIMGVSRQAYIYFTNHGYEIEDSGKYKTENVLARVVDQGIQEDVDLVKQAIEEKDIQYLIIASSWNMKDYMETVGCSLVGSSTNYQLYRVGDETKIDEISINFDGVTENKNIIFISDLHDTDMDATVTDKNQDTVIDRRDNMFVTSVGTKSKDYWTVLSSHLDAYQADGIIFGGDMIDYVSQTNIDSLKAGLDKIQTPYIYLRADHDLGTWYTEGSLNKTDAIELQQQASDYSDVYVMDYDEFYVVGWNNSTSQMSQNALDEMKAIFAEGKPIILATHVPLNSLVDNGLYEAAKAADGQNRVKLWGENCLYQPDKVTQQFIDMVCADDSPVKAVLSGHLHFKYTTQLTENITEYVFNPTFKAYIAMISIGNDE